MISSRNVFYSISFAEQNQVPIYCSTVDVSLSLSIFEQVLPSHRNGVVILLNVHILAICGSEYHFFKCKFEL